jgi:YesN/AraC family two-component response regulator
MTTIKFTSPPMPHYIISGEDTYSIGDAHRSRKDIGVFDLIVVTRGCLHISEENTDYSVTSGHYLLLRPDRKHRATHTCSEETHFYWLHFQTLGYWCEGTDQYSTFHAHQENPFIQIDPFFFFLSRFGALFSPPDIEELMRQINRLTHEPFATARWRQQVLFQELLLKLQQRKHIRRDASQIQVAEDAAAYLRHHYRESVSYSDLADSIHFHPNYISLCMKSVFGCTPLEFLTRHRIEQAKLMLIHTNDPIGTIAEKSGFGTFPFFVRCFKKHTGHRPRDYRNNFRE